MQVFTEKLVFKTEGNSSIKNITEQVALAIQNCPLKSGTVTVFIPGATGALTTLEFEPGLVADLKAFVEKVLPEAGNYGHNITHADKNGHSHIRASLIGPSLVVPFTEKKLLLGFYQQIIFMDFDNRPRDRELIIQIMGI